MTLGVKRNIGGKKTKEIINEPESIIEFLYIIGIFVAKFPLKQIKKEQLKAEAKPNIMPKGLTAKA